MRGRLASLRLSRRQQFFFACGQGSSLQKRAMGALRCDKWGEHTRTLPHKKKPLVPPFFTRQVLRGHPRADGRQDSALAPFSAPLFKNKERPGEAGCMCGSWPQVCCVPAPAESRNAAGMGRLRLCRYPTLDPFLAPLDHSERSGCARPQLRRSARPR